jgi:uncharacterized membrane protein
MKEDLFMSTITRSLCITFFPIVGILLLNSYAAEAANSVSLYSPYSKISVPPGESIDYSIDVINGTSEIQTVDITIAGIPNGWSYILKSGAWNISRIAVMPGEKKSIALKVEVPMQVDKGSYRFKVIAGSFYTLPLTVVVSEQGTYKTEFTTKQPNMEGNSTSTFTYRADLKNRTADNQLYALTAQAPRGWDVTFKVQSKQVTAVDIDANGSQEITIEVNPPDEIEAGTYKLPVSASTSTTSADLELEVAITGSYKMELTTPTGLLSTSITAGDEKRLQLLIKNNGSSKLTDIKLQSGAPANWDVIFDPKNVEQLAPGSSVQVYATIKADRKAIAGDYVTNMEARTPEVTSKATFRISVKTPMLWGWVGVLIILLAAGSIYYLFRNYGRR